MDAQPSLTLPALTAEERRMPAGPDERLSNMAKTLKEFE